MGLLVTNEINSPARSGLPEFFARRKKILGKNLVEILAPGIRAVWGEVLLLAHRKQCFPVPTRRVSLTRTPELAWPWISQLGPSWSRGHGRTKAKQWGRKEFVRDHLFGQTVEFENANTLRNLSELAATKTIIEGFKKAINALTVSDKGNAEIRDRIKLRQTRPFVAKDQGFMLPKRSVFNRIIGDSGFELEFAAFLDGCDGEIAAFAKNYFAVGFKLDYVNADGNISTYTPDFIVRTVDARVFIVETKGQEDTDVPLKMARLRQWCEDINAAQSDVRYDFAFVDEEGFKKYPPKMFADLEASFREYDFCGRWTRVLLARNLPGASETRPPAPKKVAGRCPTTATTGHRIAV